MEELLYGIGFCVILALACMLLRRHLERGPPGPGPHDDPN